MLYSLKQEPLQNLMFRIGDADVYAKVTEAGDKGYRLCFTSKPDNLAGLLSGNPSAGQDRQEP